MKRKNDKDLTKAELISAIEKLESVMGDYNLFKSFSKHMQGGLLYRLGKFRRLLREKK